jgi:hypothetical protein
VIEIAVLKTFNSANHRASVQLVGSLTTYLDDIPVSVAIAPSSLVIGNRVLLAIPGGNIRDAVIIASWPGGTPPGMAVHGNEFHNPAFTTRSDILALWGSSPNSFEAQLEFFNWGQVVSGSGSTERLYGMNRCSSGTTANSTARTNGYLFGWITWSGFTIDMHCFLVPRGSVTTARRWYKLDTNTHGDPTGNAIGWRLDNLALRGIVHNGTILTVVDLGMSLPSDTGWNFFLRFIPGTRVEWWVDGVLRGHSTAIPTTLRQASHHPVLCIENGGTAANCTVEIWEQKWRRLA